MYKGPITKWTSVNLIATGFLCMMNLSIKWIVYINDVVAYFYFSTIFDKKKKSYIFKMLR